MFQEIFSQARKVIPAGAVDVVVVFHGEYVFETPLEDGTTGYDGNYIAEIRFDDGGNIDPSYTCIRYFETEDGSIFDPLIPFSEIDIFEHYPYNIIGFQR